MAGIIQQINVSLGGVPKTPVGEAWCGRLGLEGDLHARPEIHGGPKQALLLITAEGLDELAAQGFQVGPGSLGENLTTSGLSRGDLRLGQRLQVGGALIELTKMRAPCKTLHVYGPILNGAVYDKAVKLGDATSPRWGLAGFYASVLEEGLIRANDKIAIVGTIVATKE